MTAEDRGQAVIKFGFTERQARFLVTVMLHSGVCLPRQYERFAGIVHGKRTGRFFRKLIKHGYAAAYPCLISLRKNLPVRLPWTMPANRSY